MKAWQRGRRTEGRKEGEREPAPMLFFVNKSVHLPLHREQSSLHNAASTVHKTRRAGKSEKRCEAGPVSHNMDGAQPPGNDR